MKKMLLIALSFALYCHGVAQDTIINKTIKNKIFKGLTDNACKCIDSIDITDKSVEEVTNDINRCIDNQASAYQLSAKLLNSSGLNKNDGNKDEKKNVNISINVDKNSNEYKKYYYDIERYLMDSCKSLKSKAASINKPGEKSHSQNQQARDWYSMGVEELNNENFSKAIEYFKESLAIDQEFAFAWDNLGLCYRKTNELDKAINAYEKSLKIDPNGIMPLQNLGIVYQYKKEYDKAINAYERLAKVDSNNPEVYYGIGQIYSLYLNDNEKGLDNMCKAYSLYVEQKSPYRTDAEKIIGIIYKEMKKQGKEDKFNEILKLHNISPD